MKSKIAVKAQNTKFKVKMPVAEDENSDSEQELDPEAHKKSLEKLKKTDPDFYNFLEENDENLLNFGVDSEDDEASEKGDEDQDAEDVHRPGPLQGDSDESDFEDEDAKQHAGKITLKIISKWQEELQTEGKVKLATLSNVIKAFNAAMLRATSDDGNSTGEFKVEGSAVFNAVIQMCVLYLPPAIKKYLGLEAGKLPQKCKHFVKIKGRLIAYLNDLLKLLGSVTSNNILSVLLKHLHQMCTYVACFSRVAKLALKKLINLWSTGEETVRVLAFLCILRITRNQQSSLLDLVLKAMYMTYVKNSKFVSPSTWPGINFMRRSLVEMFSLDLNVSYQHVFLYIRQLAIHLRNAIVVQKVENRQAVYNWQFINSLHLWGDLLGATSNKPQLQPLVYPLVMVITNTIKLVPTHQYYPLRFHCVEILINLSKESNTFIPVLPYLVEKRQKYTTPSDGQLYHCARSLGKSNQFPGFLLHTSVPFHEITPTDCKKASRKMLHINKSFASCYHVGATSRPKASAKNMQVVKVLTNYDFSKKHKKVSMKPLDFSCILRLAKSQLMENGFKDSVIDRLYSLLLEYTANESHTIAFPDVTLLAVVQLKHFLKSCSISNYTKKMRQLVEKIEENAKFIEKERAKISFSLSEEKTVTAWEASIRGKGTPLMTFYENWSKVNKIQKRKKVSKNEELATELPMIKRRKLSESTEVKTKEDGPVQLFPSDSEEEKDFFETEEENKPKEKKINKKKKDKKKKVNKNKNVEVDDVDDKGDVVKEMSVNDW